MSGPPQRPPPAGVFASGHVRPPLGQPAPPMLGASGSAGALAGAAPSYGSVGGGCRCSRRRVSWGLRRICRRSRCLLSSTLCTSSSMLCHILLFSKGSHSPRIHLRKLSLWLPSRYSRGWPMQCAPRGRRRSRRRLFRKVRLHLCSSLIRCLRLLR
jgi:hypothetical protein